MYSVLLSFSFTQDKLLILNSLVIRVASGLQFRKLVVGKKHTALAGWFRGAMVSRCTCALSVDLAVGEFRRLLV